MSFNDDYRKRTKDFSLNAIKLFQTLPKKEEAKIIGKQFLRSATSAGSNFKAATRARSRAEFYSKLSIVIDD
jgi:four helix bundle protein